MRLQGWVLPVNYDKILKRHETLNGKTVLMENRFSSSDPFQNITTVEVLERRRRIARYLSYNKYQTPRQEVAPDRNNEPREKDKTVEAGGRSRSQIPEPSIHPCLSHSLLFSATRSYATPGKTNKL